jgi:hypothetical protein
VLSAHRPKGLVLGSISRIIGKETETRIGDLIDNIRTILSSGP